METSGERLAISGQTPATQDNMHNRRVYPAEGTILSLCIARRSNDQSRIKKKTRGQVLGQKSPASLSTGEQRWAIKNADTTKASQKRRPTPQTHPEARPSRTPRGRGTKVTPVNGHSFGSPTRGIDEFRRQPRCNDAALDCSKCPPQRCASPCDAGLH